MNDAVQQDRRLRRVQTIGYLLDDAIRIPLVGYRIGWDALIGLIPGVGDVAGFVLSAYLVFEASRYGLPSVTLVRMVFNIVLEAVLGAIPVAGDVFDAAWKSNRKNLTLLEAHLRAEDSRPQASDRRFLAAVALVLLAVLVLAGFGVFLVVRLVLSLLSG